MQELQPKHTVIVRQEHGVQKSVHHHLSQVFRIRTALIRLQSCQAIFLVLPKHGLNDIFTCHVKAENEVYSLSRPPSHLYCNRGICSLSTWQCFRNIYKFPSNLTYAQGARLCKRDIMLILGNHHLPSCLTPCLCSVISPEREKAQFQ